MLYLPSLPYFTYFTHNVFKIITKIGENTPENTVARNESKNIKFEFSKFQYGVLGGNTTEKSEEENKITENEKDKTAEKEAKLNVTNTNEMNDKEHTNNKTSDKTSDTSNSEEMENEDNDAHILQKFRFPLGSVVAKVDMFFLAEEEYETTLEGNNTHTHTYTRMHTYMRTRIQTRTHRLTCTNTQTQIHT